MGFGNKSGWENRKEKCTICGGAFPTKQHRQFCSDKCRLAKYPTRYKNDPEFRLKRIKEASDRQKKTRREVLAKMKRHCVVCLQTFIPTRQNVKYCTRKCYKKLKSVRKAANRRERIKSDPSIKLRTLVSSYIHKAVKKRGKPTKLSVAKYLTYTIPQLKAHLESFFNNKNGFTWENHGDIWQIDHVIPQEYFPYTELDSKMFRDCWALSNLVPAPKWFNSFKSDRFAGSIDDDGQLFLFL